MAARGIGLGYLLTAVCLSLAAAVATFQLKHAVRDLDRQLAEVAAGITRERWAIQSARADLAYLTRPERLAMQAAQLAMVPARGARLVRAEQILTLRQLEFATVATPAVLPSGAAVSLRMKPLPLLAFAGDGEG